MPHQNMGLSVPTMTVALPVTSNPWHPLIQPPAMLKLSQMWNHPFKMILFGPTAGIAGMHHHAWLQD
jgi:hypothetical protein